MSDLAKKWLNFAIIVLDPWTLLLIVVGYLFYYYFEQVNEAEDASTISITVINIMLMVTSGVAASRMATLWINREQSGVLAARAKVAIRNLKLLLRNVTDLQERVKVFRCDPDPERISKELTAKNYAEIERHCTILQEEVINSIENWTDITPEADIRTQIGELTKSQNALRSKEQELKATEQKLDEAKDQSKESREKLQDKIGEMQHEMRRLKSEQSKRAAALGSLAAIGSSGIYVGPQDSVTLDPLTQSFVSQQTSLSSLCHCGSGKQASDCLHLDGPSNVLTP